MQGIYTYIPETNYVHREYSVLAILLLLFMALISLVSVLNLLYFCISTFRSVCTVPNMAVFCSSLTSYFPGMLLTYFLNDFETVPVAPITTGIIFVFTFHMRCISIVRYLYFRIFSASFLITSLSPEIATSINIHVPFSLSRIIMYGLLLGILLLLFNYYFAVSCHRPFFPGVSTLEPTVILTARASKFQIAILSVLCVMFHAQLSFVVALMNVFLLWLPNFSLKPLLPFRWLLLSQE